MLGRPVADLLVVLGSVVMAVLPIHVGEQHMQLLLGLVQVQIKVGCRRAIRRVSERIVGIVDK
jgi:hypothetical protein